MQFQFEICFRLCVKVCISGKPPILYWSFFVIFTDHTNGHQMKRQRITPMKLIQACHMNIPQVDVLLISVFSHSMVEGA